MLKHRKDDRGAALVEFSLVLVLLFMLIFGIITYGFMMSFRQNMTQAAAEGARAGAVAIATNSTTDARLAVQQAVGSFDRSCPTTNGVDTDNDGLACTVTVATCSNNAAKECVTVRLQYNYKDHPLLPAPVFGAALPDSLSSTSVAEVST